MKSVYLALDIGGKRIGAAVGTVAAFGRGVIASEPLESALQNIKKLIEDEGVTELVIGVPYTGRDIASPSQELALTWITRLKTETELPLYIVNEAYSSVEAERLLRQEGVNTRSDKGKIDERAAILLLEQYLANKDDHERI